jgi:hypothetical protein
MGILFGSPQRQFQGSGEKLDRLIDWQRATPPRVELMREQLVLVRGD